MRLTAFTTPLILSRAFTNLQPDVLGSRGDGRNFKLHKASSRYQLACVNVVLGSKLRFYPDSHPIGWTSIRVSDFHLNSQEIKFNDLLCRGNRDYYGWKLRYIWHGMEGQKQTNKSGQLKEQVCLNVWESTIFFGLGNNSPLLLVY